MLAAHDGVDLIRFIPVFDPHETEIRVLWMRPALHKWVYQGDRKATLSFKPKIRAFLGRYVKGEWIDNREFMKCWKENVWELRVQLQPRREATRIFGAFAKPDEFVATHWRLRSSLGGKTDPAWDQVIYRVVDEWDRLFPGERRVRARPFSNCVTSKGHDYGS